MNFRIFISAIFLFISLSQSGCNFLTHETLSNEITDSTSGQRDPNYNVSLDFNYQDFTSYLYMGNRVENFTAYFNTFYKSRQDFDDAMDEYRTSLISYYNRRLDSLGITPLISAGVKDKLEKAIERSSKIIQFHKNSKFIDDAVLIIGESYYFLADYYKAERTFNEFLSKFSSSILADEAILFLGRTKVKLDKSDEGIIIFKNLFKNSVDNEIKSLAAKELGILAYNAGNFQDAVNYFKSSIDFSTDKESKAEGQFILAKILTGYKPQLAAKEFKKAIDYTSDFDLTFFARLNYAKGLLVNKDYRNAKEELEAIRKKYRDEISFAQLVDLEIANTLYAENKIREAKDKYYEIIVKYPNTPVSSDAYYRLAKHEEDINHDYLNAYVNYKKAVEENVTSDFYKESSAKSSTFEKYFSLLDEVGDSVKVNIPTSNAEVEKFRKNYNEEKGIQQNEINKDGDNNNKNKSGEDGTQTGDGKGKAGAFKSMHYEISDSVKEKESNAGPGPNSNPGPGPVQNPSKNPGNKSDVTSDSLDSEKLDSIKAVEELTMKKEKDDKVFNAYYEIAELFMYNLHQQDSAEHYLKLLISKFTDSDKQGKLLYTLGYFYKNSNRQTEAEETFRKVISNYPNSVYAVESKKILGIKVNDSEVFNNPLAEIFKTAMDSLNSKKYNEAINILQNVEIKYPSDSMLAKALYSIGWIYENDLSNKDSSLHYYKKLKEKFPNSEYTAKVQPLLEYMASLEAPEKTDSTKENSSPDDSTKILNPELNLEEKKVPEESVEVKTDTTKTDKENKLSQEEIDKLLKETDGNSDPQK